MNNVEKQKEPGALQKLRDKLTGTIGASTKVFGDLEAQVELKNLKDAIQERSTKKVDVREQTTDGGTVGEGNVQQGPTTESVTTETETESVEILDDNQYAQTPFLLRSRTSEGAFGDGTAYTGNELDTEELYIEASVRIL